MTEYKKKAEDHTSEIDGYEEYKKKTQREQEAFQQRLQALADENDKLNKSKKKLQSEVRQEVIVHCVN